MKSSSLNVLLISLIFRTNPATKYSECLAEKKANTSIYRAEFHDTTTLVRVSKWPLHAPTTYPLPPRPQQEISPTADGTSSLVPLPGAELARAHPCVIHAKDSERPPLATHLTVTPCLIHMKRDKTHTVHRLTVHTVHQVIPLLFRTYIP